jgi:hypothetical protein
MPNNKLKVVIRNNSDPADPEETLEFIEEEANYSLLNKLMLETCQKFNITWRTVNMDNYYTSPAVFILLRNRGVCYARGTVKKNRWMAPSQFFSPMLNISAPRWLCPDGAA